MVIIAGLGNFPREYTGTRHNVGFEAIDSIAKKHQIEVKKTGFHARYGQGRIDGIPVLLAKPQTYMNLSGRCVAELVSYFHIQAEEELLVIYDDIHLEPGNLRIRKKGSAGGHNGMKSIIQELGHSEFCRIRIGVGEQGARQDLIDHVLGKLTGTDRELVDEAVIRCVGAVETILAEDVDAAMNVYNQKVQGE